MFIQPNADLVTQFITDQSDISISPSERVSILIEAELRLQGFYWLTMVRYTPHLHTRLSPSTPGDANLFSLLSILLPLFIVWETHIDHPQPESRQNTRYGVLQNQRPRGVGLLLGRD